VDRSFALPLPRTLRRPRRIALPRRAVAWLLGVLLALPLLGGAWLWLRDSSLVAVEHVRVLGARGPEAHAVEAALEEAGLRMTTLHVNVAALQAAVAPLRVVRAVRVSTGFPHTLRVRVVEQLPVAALVLGGTRTAVAADGVVLGPALLSSSLPVVSGAFTASAAFTASGAPGASDGPLDTGHVHGATALAALTVLGAAPPALAGWVARVYDGREGLTVAMRNGLLIYFGDASRPHAKWLSAARVLASPSSAGAWYIDVRLPERPAAGISGGTSGTGSAATRTGTPTEVSASDPTAASLAEVLAQAVNGSAGSSSAASLPAASTTALTSTSISTAPAPTTTASTAAGEAPAGSQSDAPAGGSEAASGTGTTSGAPSDSPTSSLGSPNAVPGSSTVPGSSSATPGSSTYSTGGGAGPGG
jgi:cell division protein FtsQ